MGVIIFVIDKFGLNQFSFNIEHLWADYSIMKHAGCIQFTKSVYILACLHQFVQS